jgi:hypothetical protein
VNPDAFDPAYGDPLTSRGLNTRADITLFHKRFSLLELIFSVFKSFVTTVIFSFTADLVPSFYRYCTFTHIKQSIPSKTAKMQYTATLSYLLYAASLAMSLPVEKRQFSSSSGGSTRNDVVDGKCAPVTLIFARGSTEPGV